MPKCRYYGRKNNKENLQPISLGVMHVHCWSGFAEFPFEETIPRSEATIIQSKSVSTELHSHSFIFSMTAFWSNDFVLQRQPRVPRHGKLAPPTCIRNNCGKIQSKSCSCYNLWILLGSIRCSVCIPCICLLTDCWLTCTVEAQRMHLKLRDILLVIFSWPKRPTYLLQ